MHRESAHSADAEATQQESASNMKPPPDAFVMNLANNQLRLRSFIHTLVRRTADVDDILQETNMVLWEKRDEYDDARPFMPWACRFAHLQVLAFLKRHQRHAHYALDEQLCQAIAGESMHHLEQMEARLGALRECLGQLPARNRALIDERYSENIPVQQIAERHGRSADSVSMRLYRIRRALADCVRRVMRREQTP